MIKKNQKFGISESVIIAEFGQGDLSVGGMYLQEDKSGYLSISDLLEPLNIGEINQKRLNKDLREFDNDILLKFTKTQSIDVLIRQLLEIKSFMVQDSINLEVKVLQNQ